ncbi:glycosyltransferase family 2 protein [Effusibacillus lacus]|uniref:Glycosyl transferase family 2 n=1 Tax=Effusibacillus lacus TaxID=1348429 RepID=A0A292YIZ0_9BACL|nr:glycosyltransferase family 2 protein [Effusibacillus lacus]TCS74274.1 glycosyltransferase involved in cell wall biosynthesis [Effusibacillus lacus]GAX88733.1 glycosyl transferase family 2 [Effusibacillus lacus]
MRKLIVVIPAYNEEDSIATVIRKVPRNFDPQTKVAVLVVDDGSTDRTVDAAFEAGADRVLSFGRNRGLGAAVREGLREAYRLGADFAVMIDADDEYPADCIPQVVAPVVLGEADYVLASRFAGTIQGMKLHRRLGNYFFTLLQSALLRRIITDGQTGFRAFSRQVLATMDIIHDYNYAQVMTLNIVRQGYRMAEVPIPYKVRTTGRSFIRFWAYMRNVLPAIVKEMRRKPGEDRRGNSSKDASQAALTNAEA